MYGLSAEIYDLIYSFKDYPAEAEKLRLFAAERGQRGGALLDVACGTGMHLQHMVPHYERVAGLDQSAEMLAYASRRLPGITLVQGDMLDFDLGERFDLITCLFGSIAYMRSEERLRQAVANMARHLRPRGLLMVEPFLRPEECIHGYMHHMLIEQPEIRIVRMATTRVEDGVYISDMHHLISTPQATRHVVEHHEMALFSDASYRRAFEAVGLHTEIDPVGLTNRRLVLGQRS